MLQLIIPPLFVNKIILSPNPKVLQLLIFDILANITAILRIEKEIFSIVTLLLIKMIIFQAFKMLLPLFLKQHNFVLTWNKISK